MIINVKYNIRERKSILSKKCTYAFVLCVLFIYLRVFEPLNISNILIKEICIIFYTAIIFKFT